MRRGGPHQPADAVADCAVASGAITIDGQDLRHVTQASLRQAIGIVLQDTALVIAHWLSTVVDAHQIVVLHAGRAVERGSHAELLAQEGRYAEMWRL